MLYLLHTPFELYVTKRAVREIEVRDYMTAGDILEARRLSSDKHDSFEVGLHLIARVAGLDIKDIARMDMRDVDALDAHIAEIRKDPKVVAAEKAAADSSAQ